MIKSLYIKNFALIEEAEIQFDRGLNVITGETGAGKSILIGALSMILGERASLDLVRSGADRAIIEATVSGQNNQKLEQCLKSKEIEWDEEEIVLRREISSKGQNRCFINDSLITNAALKEIGDFLVDLHGQHEHQYLLRQEVHIDILDEFVGLNQKVAVVHAQFKRVNDLRSRITDLLAQKESFHEKREIYEHQLKEISEVGPSPNEDEDLLQEEKLLGSSEKLYELTSRVHETLYDTESSVVSMLGKLVPDVEMLKNIDDRFGEIQRQFEASKISLEEISRWMSDYNHKIRFNPERLEEIRDRIARIQRLKKKYGSIDSILLKQKELQEFIHLSENFDFEIDKLNKQLESEIKVYREQALGLSKERKKAAEILERQVEIQMTGLGMDHAQFKVYFEHMEDQVGWLLVDGRPIKATIKGIDRVEFFLSTNLGESLKPLVKVASGGEVSRIMLSLKAVLAESDKIPSLIFDEIDVGISGRIAQAVGKTLSDLAHSHQTICITHLPQIASQSTTHFSVIKKVVGSKTVTQIKKLSPEEKIQEVAKLLGGEMVTETTLENAKELIQAGR